MVYIVFICNNKSPFTMSPELAEFSELIDEHFELVDTEPEDFWQMIINMFI